MPSNGVELGAAIGALSGYVASGATYRLEMVSAIATLSAEHVLKEFCCSFASKLKPNRELWTGLNRIRSLNILYPRVWHRSVQRCRDALGASDPREATGAAAELLIQHRSSLTGSIQLDCPVAVRVLGQGGFMDLELAGFRSKPPFDQLEYWSRPAHTERIRLVCPRFDGLRGRISQWSPALSGDASRSAQQRARLSKGYSFLRDVAPRAASWVRQVTRILITVPPPSENVSVSSSDFALPGEITLSIPKELAALAESYVHECAHQYLHLAELIKPIDNGTDTQLYYSPIKRTGRPIRAILVAFHAFANVALYYEDVLASAAPRRAKLYCAIHRDRTLADLKVLAEHLHVSPGLSDIGRGLWTPLFQTLSARGLLPA